MCGSSFSSKVERHQYPLARRQAPRCGQMAEFRHLDLLHTHPEIHHRSDRHRSDLCVKDGVRVGRADVEVAWPQVGEQVGQTGIGEREIGESRA